MARGAPPANVRVEGGHARAATGKRVEIVRGQLPRTLRRIDEPQELGSQVGRLPHRLRHVEDPRRALLPLDGRLPTF